MAVSMRAQAAIGCSRPVAASRAVVVCKAQGEQTGFAKVQIAAASMAAVALIFSAQPAPVQAGVVYSSQPQLKKVFQGEAAEPVKERAFRQPGAKSAAPEVKAPEAKKASEPLGEGGIDPRALALPASLVVIAGLGAAATKVDSGFYEWFTSSGPLVRDSAQWAGFEEELKGNNYRWAQDFGVAKAGGKVGTVKTGTKATKKGTVKK